MVLHAEEIFKNRDLIGFIKKQKSSNFLLYSWGQDLNNIRNRITFKKYFDGIIYDRVFERNHKIDINLIINHKDFAENNFNPNFDSVFITGSNEALGNWDVNRAVKLDRKIQNSNFDEWAGSIEVEEKKFDYKFLIARESPNGNELLVKRLDLNKRVFNGISLTCDNIWASDNKQIVKGWLLQNQFEIQFNFYNSPLKIVSDSSKHSIKITPILVNHNGKSNIFDDYISDFTVCILEQRLKDSLK